MYNCRSQSTSQIIESAKLPDGMSEKYVYTFPREIILFLKSLNLPHCRPCYFRQLEFTYLAVSEVSLMFICWKLYKLSGVSWVTLLSPPTATAQSYYCGWRACESQTTARVSSAPTRVRVVEEWVEVPQLDLNELFIELFALRILYVGMSCELCLWIYTDVIKETKNEKDVHV